jgi:hypothetical protein
MKKTAPVAIAVTVINAGTIPCHREIAIQAEALWRDRGCPQGCDHEIWLEAEMHLYRKLRRERDERDEQTFAALNGTGGGLMGELESRFPGSNTRATTAL